MQYLRALACAAALVGLTSQSGEAAPNSVDVLMETSAGKIVVRLDTAHAPRTSANFLRYVDGGRFNGASFYRNVTRATAPTAPFEVIQGGLDPQAPDPSTQPIVLEPTSITGIRNDDGTIAMARTSDPNSATTEFFIDLGNARYLDATGPLAPGYAAFGRVVRGMEVVRRIHRGETNGDRLVPAVRITRMSRL